MLVVFFAFLVRVAVAVAAFANLVADHGSGSRSADGAQGGAKNGIAQQAAGHGPRAGANLGIAGPVGATAKCAAFLKAWAAPSAA